MSKDLVPGTRRALTGASGRPTLLLASWPFPGRRMRLGLLRLSVLAILPAAIHLAPAPAQANHCGGEGERACCLGPDREHSGFVGCEGTLREKSHAACNLVLGAGNCRCGDDGADLAGLCVEIKPCGGEGQRACCPADPEPRGCDPGLAEIQDCDDPLNCFCPDTNVRRDLCADPMCGELNERGCCIAAPERAAYDGACDHGLVEVAGCSGDCRCTTGSASSIGTCRALTPCGHEGQRECLEIDPMRPGDVSGPCAEGLVRIDGCGWDLPSLQETGTCKVRAGAFSVQTCVRPTPCGGPGQRECCTAESRYIEIGGFCEEGLVELSGCVGDCFCGEPFPADETTLFTCGYANPGDYAPSDPEPTTGWTPPEEARSCPLRGYADIHAHMMSDIAYGRKVSYGAPAPRDPDTGQFTLQPDDGMDIRSVFSPEGDESLHATHRSLGDPPFDPIGSGTKDFAAQVNGHRGWPEFNNFPHWTSTTHQKMYYSGIERAYRGGLRLMVQFAVTNEALCIATEGDHCEDSMGSVDRQIVSTWDFQRFIDDLNGGPGEGWFRIVTTPQQAREVIAEDKLAVVLGIEMDNLFNCKEQNDATSPQPCPDVSPKDADECAALPLGDKRPLPEGSSLEDTVAWYYDCYGIRHVFPVHNFDNAFGATATWQDAINVGQRAAIGRFQDAPVCPGSTCAADPNLTCPVEGEEGYGFDFNRFIIGFIAAGGFGDLRPIPSWPGETVCNTHGLNLYSDDRDGRGKGGELIDALMDHGMIIDVDHYSIKSFDDQVSLGAARFASFATNHADLAADYPYTGYPMVASHVQSFALHKNQPGGAGTRGGLYGRHERMRTAEQLAAIRDSGGMIAAMGKDDAQDGDHSGEKWTTAYEGSFTSEPIADDCRHSSKTFGQAYQYAVDTMQAPVAFGLDMNGIAGNVGPRFGSSGCGGRYFNLGEDHDIEEERSAQILADSRLAYPFSLEGFGSFEKQRWGLRTWDFNKNGLSHMGLLPDLVADLGTIGIGQPYLDALFDSAEEYIRVWERSELVGMGKPIPETTAALSCPEICLDPDLDDSPPPIDCTDVTIECTGQSTRVLTSAFAAHGEDNCGGEVSLGCDRTGSFPVGPTTVSCTATDEAGNESGECEALIFVTDTNAPSITAPLDLSDVECTSPSGASPALGSADASDLCDPTLEISNDAPSVFPVGANVVTWTARDDSGNVSQAVQTVTVVDSTPPSNTCPGNVTIECDESREPSNTGEATATDVCDSAPQVTSSDAVAAGACADESVITRTWSATDAAGNAGEDCDQTITVVDTTAPVIACNAPGTIVPPDTAISFTATAPDNCDPDATVEVVGFDCFAFTRMGRRIDKTEDGCVTAIDGDTFTILDSGGVGDTITWTVRATDRCGEVSQTVCQVEVVTPSNLP